MANDANTSVLPRPRARKGESNPEYAWRVFPNDALNASR